MGFYKVIYNIFSYPFGWLIWLFYSLFNKNYLAAVIILAVLVKLVLLPTSINQQKNTVKTKRMQAKINKIKEKYPDPSEQQQAIQDFYAKEGFGSMSTGCGALLIQMPVIMGLYGAIYMPLTYILRLNKNVVSLLTDTVTSIAPSSGGRTTRWMEIPVLNYLPELKEKLGDKFPDADYATLTDFANHFKAGHFNFGDIPSQVWHDQRAIVIIPILAFAAAMATSIYSLIRSRRMGQSDMTSMATMGCMLMFMPFMSLWLSWSFPVGIGIYWAVNSFLGFVQMIALDKLYTPDKVIGQVLVDETNVRRSKELVVKKAAD